jgi:hypothetical protein
MASTQNLIELADAYKVAAGLDRDQTVSYRVFGDSKKLSDLRAGAGITVSRFNAAMEWFGQNWPEGKAFPKGLLRDAHVTAHGNAAASPQGERNAHTPGEAA